MPAILKRLGLLPSYTVEWAWVTGRIIVALGVIVGATLVAQESPAYPLYIGICVVFLGCAAFMAVLLMRHQLFAVFLIGSFMENALPYKASPFGCSVVYQFGKRCLLLWCPFILRLRCASLRTNGLK